MSRITSTERILGAPEPSIDVPDTSDTPAPKKPSKPDAAKPAVDHTEETP
jgi:hypothetical protein